MPNLDGKDEIKPVPFDAHEQAQREASADYEHQKFPKAVDHVDHPSGVGKEPVLVNSPAEEKAYRDAQAKAQAEEPKTSA